MTLEQGVSSLELSKRLKELGVPQNAFWSWYTNAGDAQLIHNPDGYRSIDQKTFDAYSVAELGDILSSTFNEWSQGWNDSGCFWHFMCGDKGSGSMIASCGNSFSALDLGGEDEPEATEANARASCIIYLLENGLLKLPL